MKKIYLVFYTVYEQLNRYDAVVSIFASGEKSAKNKFDESMLNQDINKDSYTINRVEHSCTIKIDENGFSMPYSLGVECLLANELV